MLPSAAAVRAVRPARHGRGHRVGDGRLPRSRCRVGYARTATPADGSLTLVMADNPLTLRSWTVVDAQRHETRVTLYDVQLGGTFDQKLFVFIDPKFFQNNSN